MPPVAIQAMIGTDDMADDGPQAEPQGEAVEAIVGNETVNLRTRQSRNGSCLDSW
jgi:hypothetical protein